MCTYSEAGGGGGGQKLYLLFLPADFNYHTGALVTVTVYLYTCRKQTTKKKKKKEKKSANKKKTFLSAGSSLA